MTDKMRIIGDFVLCQDVTPSGIGCFLFGTPEDDRMSADNLHIFEVVQLPEHGIDTSKYVPMEVGDKVISISTGTDLRLDNKTYKLFELQYITAKIGA